MTWNECWRKPKRHLYLEVCQENLEELRELEDDGLISVHTDEDDQLEGVHVLTGSDLTMAADPGCILVREPTQGVIPTNAEVFEEEFTEEKPTTDG